MFPILKYTHTLLHRTWNMVQMHTTTQPSTQAHWITNIHKVKISMPLPLSSLQHKPHNQHPHIFTDISYRNGIPSRAIRTSPGLIERRRHIGVKTRHSLQENKNQHKWMFSHLTLSDKWDALYCDFTSGEARAGSDGYYRLEVGTVSSAWIIESNYVTQYIQGVGMVPVKPE